VQNVTEDYAVHVY